MSFGAAAESASIAESIASGWLVRWAMSKYSSLSLGDSGFASIASSASSIASSAWPFLIRPWALVSFICAPISAKAAPSPPFFFWRNWRTRVSWNCRRMLSSCGLSANAWR